MRPDDDTKRQARDDAEQPRKRETSPIILVPFELRSREAAHKEADALAAEYARRKQHRGR